MSDDDPESPASPESELPKDTWALPDIEIIYEHSGERLTSLYQDLPTSLKMTISNVRYDLEENQPSEELANVEILSSVTAKTILNLLLLYVRCAKQVNPKNRYIHETSKKINITQIHNDIKDINSKFHDHKNISLSRGSFEKVIKEAMENAGL
jgi:hypothetical protein